MTTTQAILLGMMIAYTPSLLFLAWMLFECRDRRNGKVFAMTDTRYAMAEYDDHDEDMALMDDVAQRGWPSRKLWSFVRTTGINAKRPLPVDDVAWARELQRRRDFERRMKN